MNFTQNSVPEMSDAMLFALEAGGGPLARDAAFALDARFRTRLVHTVSGVVGVRAADVEDVVQCAFMDMWEHRGRAPGGDEHFRRWLFTIAKCVAIDFVRRRGAMDPLPEVGPAAPGPGPQTQVRRAERDVRLLDAVGQLPSPIQAAMRLRILEGQEVENVARALDVPTRRIRKRILRGCELLRPLLGPEFEELAAAA